MSEWDVVAMTLLASIRGHRVEARSVLFRPVPPRRFRGPSGGDATRTLRARPLFREEQWKRT
jgi:hypothetical protein